MARYSGIITDDQKLTPIAGVSIQVDDSATGEAATLTADDGDPLDNPLTTDAFGAFYFNAADAVYDLTYRYGGRIVRKDQPIVGEPPAFIGPTGPANVLTIGSVTKIAAGGTPTAEITGTTPTQTLNIGLVTGDKGDTGPTGATGNPGYTSTDTWAHLNAITPSSGAGSTGFAVGPDTGTHTDANGLTNVPNTGQFTYQASPAGWIRIGSAINPFDPLGLTTQRQTIGYPGAIPDGTNNASAAYFLIYDPILGDGIITTFRGYFSGSGTASLQRYTQVGGNWVTVGSPYVLAIPGSGLRSISMYMLVNEGEYIAINSTVMRYVGTAAAPALGDVSDGGGLFSGMTNGLAVTLVPTLAARLHVAIDLVFRSKRAATQRNLITVRSSDKIVFVRNSYARDIYALRGKGYVQKIADLTAWRVENYSIQGDANDLLLASAQARTYLNGTLSLWDVGPTWVVAGELTNSSNNASGAVTATVINNYRQLAQSMKALGGGLIVPTEHIANFVSSSIESGTTFARKIAADTGAVPLSFRATASKFSPSVGGYGTDYAGWTNSGATTHLSTRYNEILAQPFRELVATTLGRPAKSLRVFRPRPNADGTAPTIASKDALLFEPGDYVTRHALFMEIAHGQQALGTTVEKYLDEINNAAITTPSLDTIASEYLTLQVGRSLSFTDYCYVEAVLEASGADVHGVGVYVSDSGASVYVRSAFYTDATNTSPVAATAPTGRWRPLLIDSDGFARLTGRNVTGSVWGDEVCFLIVKSGSFTLTEPVVEWYGRPGKVQPPLKPTNYPNGTELVTSPYIVSAGALASGWTATGSPTFGTGIPSAGTPKMLPRGSTGNVILSTTDKVTTALTWTADLYRDREVEIVVWAATPKALQDSTTWTRSTGTITPFTNDLDTVLVEIIGGSNAVPYDRLAVGLYYTEHRFRTWAPAGSTGFSVRLSAGISSIAANRLSVKFVEA